MEVVRIDGGNELRGSLGKSEIASKRDRGDDRTDSGGSSGFHGSIHVDGEVEGADMTSRQGRGKRASGGVNHSRQTVTGNSARRHETAELNEGNAGAATTTTATGSGDVELVVQEIFDFGRARGKLDWRPRHFSREVPPGGLSRAQGLYHENIHVRSL